MDKADTTNMVINKGEGENAHASCRMGEECANENVVNRAECFMEIFQKKYKCFILYAVILISLCEFLYLIFTSQDVGREDYISLINRFLNRTANVKI